MRFRFFAFASIAASTTVLTLFACSSDPAPSNAFVVTDDDGGSTTKPKTDSGSTPPPPPPGTDAAAGPSRVYAHTDDTLYLFDSATKTATVIGKFDCIGSFGSVIDIAVDRTGAMFGTTFTGFISIDPISASCQEIASGSDYPNSLSFVPAGTVDATKEALVGYAFNASNLAQDYVRIDTTTGAMTKIGDINTGVTGASRYRASGDLISLIQAGNKSYLTVKKMDADGGATDTTTDYLAEVNPKTGAIVKILGATGVPELFGLGYWAGKGYGFASNGKVIGIDMTNGSSTLLMTLTIDGGTGSWYGAGVTTQAPVAP